MKRLSIITAIVLTGCVSDGPPSAPMPSEVERICAGEFTIGTPEYSQCLALLKAQRASLKEYEREERKKKEDEVISEDLAIQICNEMARKSIFKPIERIYYSRAIGGHRKSVSVDYKIKDDSKIIQARCTMDGRKIVDIKVS
ncbi:MAG: hypothetical protein AAGA50_05970 [Pseudomonadota bacterium]